MSEPIGSMSEEAFKLFRALSSSRAVPTSDESHVCTEKWCPVCQVAGLVRDNPDLMAQISASVAMVAKSLRDLVDSAASNKTTAAEDEEA